MSIPDRLRMPFSFDANALAVEALALDDGLWERHFNTAYYEGDWSGVALRSTGGRLSLYPGPTAQGCFSDTVALERCPHVTKALRAFRCPLNSVRFLRLGPGARVREHRDYGLEFESGEARFHVPIVGTNASEFVLDSIPISMKPGECWYVDVNKPHRVANAGAQPRVHLIIDCVVNEWLREVMNNANRD